MLVTRNECEVLWVMKRYLDLGADDLLDALCRGVSRASFF